MRRVIALAAAAAMLPDADIVGMRLGIDFAGPLGHRGITHSLLFAAVVALGAAALSRRWRPAGSGAWRIAACVFAATASHGLLDAFTDAGLGVGFFLPFDETRYVFPFTPVRAAPLHIAAFFTSRGEAVLASELFWVWIPAGVIAASAAFLRCWRSPTARPVS
jgi:inner membrane protein